MRKTCVWSLDWEDPLEKGTDIHSSLWPYYPECTGSRLILEAKQGWACLVLDRRPPGNTRCCRLFASPLLWAFLLAQSVKNLPAVQETRAWSLSLDDPPWKRKWQLTPISLPGKSHGQRTLLGCSPWNHKESGTTERLTTVLLSYLKFLFTRMRIGI